MVKNKPVPQDKEANNDNEQEKKGGKSKFWGFIKRNPVFVTIVVSLLIIAGTYGFMSIRINQMQKSHRTELYNAVKTFNVDHFKNNVRILSWAARGELIRENLEQIDQLFKNYVNLEFDEANVIVMKVMLVNPETGKIQISTNSKDDDKNIHDNQIVSARSLLVIDEGSTIRIANPINDLDKTIGIVVVELEVKEM